MGMCLMVTRPGDYTHRPNRDLSLAVRNAKRGKKRSAKLSQMDDREMARSNAQIIQTYFDFDYKTRTGRNNKSELSEYAFSGEGFFDPGPMLTFDEALLAKLNPDKYSEMSAEQRHRAVDGSDEEYGPYPEGHADIAAAQKALGRQHLAKKSAHRTSGNTVLSSDESDVPIATKNSQEKSRQASGEASSSQAVPPPAKKRTSSAKKAKPVPSTSQVSQAGSSKQDPKGKQKKRAQQVVQDEADDEDDEGEARGGSRDSDEYVPTP